MTDQRVLAPSISALGGAARRLSSLQITTDTYIQISAECPDIAIYFTTNGSHPIPPGRHAVHSSSGETHRYQAPFKLNAGLSRIVSAVAVSSRCRQSAVTTELFEVKDVNRYSRSQLEDDSSIVISDVDSFVSTDTYTLNDRITRQPSPSTGDDITEISVSDVYFSPRGRIYSRYPNTARELDTYFETNHPRVIGGYRGLGGQAWEEEEEDGWTSSESDVDSEVTNYFRMARRQQNNDTSHCHTQSHRRVCSRERRKSPYLKDDNPEFFTDSGHLQRGSYDSPRSALQGHLSPASLLENSKRTRFLETGEYSPRVGVHTDRTYTVRSAATSEAAVPRSEMEDGRQTPLSDIGYKLGYKFASGDISDISDDTTGGRLSARNESAKVVATKNGHKENKKGAGDKSTRKKWNKTRLSETIATDEDATSSSSSNSSKSTKSDRMTAKKHHSHAVKKPVAANIPAGTGTVMTPGGRHLRGSNPAMNFVNDSGTQINFWGVEPGEALQQMGTLVEGRQRPRLEESRVVPVETKLPYKNSPIDHVTESVAPPVAKTEQVSQHSIGDKFRNFFGVGSKSKSKQKQSKRKQRGQEDGVEDSYEQIKQQCLEQGCLWEDPCFPACDESLYFEEKPSVWPVEWKRPHEICSDPQLFVGGASRFDVIQGILGNCWLLAAVASLSSIEKLLYQVVSPDQSFKKDYAGVFRFRFWQYGQWVDVCVDDRLPTKNGQLIYMHSRQTNEFWTPLLEKAYAKMNSCYETLSGGLTSEAMTDFTGGVVEKFNFREELPSNMFAIMLKACERGSLLGCSIDAAGGQMEEELDNGLLRGHAYSITAVQVLRGHKLHLEEVDTKTGSEELVRVRNPWGNECEWKGAWSDKSREWQNLSGRDKQSLGLTFDHDGEFWMSYCDFSTHFQRVEICNIQPDMLTETDGATKCWEYSIKEGSWKRKVNAGGCRNNPATFWINPQFRVSIIDADDDDEEDVGTIIIGLMQRSRRRLRSQGYSNLTIGYEVYEIPEGRENSPLEQQFFKQSQPVTSSPTYINTREVCGHHRLPPGHYCIMPTTFDANEEADFIIRIFSEKPSDFVEADESTGVVQAKREAPVSSAPNSRLRSEAETKFKEYSGEDLEVDAFELQKILNSVFTKDFKFGSFDINLCRSIVALEDTDHTGQLSLDEFPQVWDLLQTWKGIYKQFDKDHSGAFNSYELREALKAAGYKLSNSAFNTAVLRYSDKDGSIKFDDFVACVVRLKMLFEVFSNASDGDSAKFLLDDFIKMALYS